MVRRLGNILKLHRGGGEKRRAAGDLKLKYREFKYLLRANNEVLSIIADLERHLADRGLVGLDFLKSRYIDASAKVFKMIRHLNNISGGRYPQLVNAFNQIRSRIDETLEEAGGRGDGSLLVPLAELEPGAAHLAGNKAANLAEIAAQGLPVPPGFVVTTAAFHRFMEHAGLGGQLRQAVMLLDGSDPRELEEFSRLLQRKVMEAPLPSELEEELNRAAGDLAARSASGRLSVRSSAVGEDSAHTFAGLYRSLLGVDPAEAAGAYRQVVAALYAPEAVVYRRQRGLLDQDAEMAALVQTMLAPAASGVLYTTDPLAGGAGPLLISAVDGLGQGLVDGSRDPDLYRVSREAKPALLDYQPAPRGGGAPLGSDAALELARLGLRLEARFGCPQDVEWALNPDGRLVILQSRPLQVLETLAPAPEVSAQPILSGGQTARPGAGSGPVCRVRGEKDLAGFPNGAVLVAVNSSPAFGAVLPRAAAVVTDVGGVAGHMASLAREMGVPTLVGTGRASKLLTPGMEVTVDATAGKVYQGRVDELLIEAPSSRLDCGAPRPRPTWHAAADYITRLNLTDPQSKEFTPANCRTFHDILRYAHEMSFQEMFRLGDRVGDQDGEARKLIARLPFELWCIDLGGGVAPEAGATLLPEQVTSLPGRALLNGLTDPAVNWNRPRPVSMGGLASVISGSLLNPPNGGLRDMGQRAYAVLGGEYLNFNCRVGYHYTALDSFCGPTQNDNYISFRFHGGAATEDRRRLRCQLIQRLLADMGFAAEQNGDQVTGFLKKYPAGPTAEILEELGRLVLFTRQMDMLMSGERMVEILARAFADKDYNLTALGKDRG